MALNVDQATTKWVQNMQGANARIEAGVNAVTVAPGERAAAQVNVWLSKIQQSKDKWVRNVKAVTLVEWQQAMITRGIPAISTGVTAKSDHYSAFAAKFYPYLATGVAHVKSMPKANLNDGIQRAVYMITYNSKYTGGNGRS